MLTILRLAGVDAMPVVEDGVVVGSVTREGLVRGLARDDATIAADVHGRLARHPEIGGWTVAVDHGEVVLRGHEPDPFDIRLVEQLAGAVIGVTSVAWPPRRHTTSSPVRLGPSALGRRRPTRQRGVGSRDRAAGW